MADLPSVLYDTEFLTTAEATNRLTRAMLRRLPPSLWDQEPSTVQGQLYAAIAAELAIWLEAWTVTRNATLLQRAEGIDLDVLLADYSLKRYNRRPDPYARQVGRQILFTPQGTLFSMQDLSQLLTDAPQLLGRSGRLQPHWWVAVCRPVTAPRTYWQLGSPLGEVWYLSLAENDLVWSSFPPAGANLTPWPDGYTPVPARTGTAFAGGRDDVATLYWCHVPDDTGTLWYLSVGTGGSAELSRTRPGPEPGTTHPLQLLDGAGEVWGLTVDEVTVSLRLTPLSTPLRTPTYCAVRDTTGQDWLLAVIRGTCVLLTPPAPLAWQDATPGGVPLDWFQVASGTQTRYVVVHAEDLFELTPDLPTGAGTTEPLIMRDVDTLVLWQWGLDATGRAIELSLAPETPPLSGAPITLLDPGFVLAYLRLHDASGVPWVLWHGPADLAVSDAVPEDLLVTDATPAGGPFTWWRRTALSGEASAIWLAEGEGACLAVGRPSPPGPGTADPQAMGDASGTLWHYGIAPDGSLGCSDWPPVAFDESATCLVLNDNQGGRWFWRMDPDTSELVISAVMEPQTIPWQPLGELGYVRVTDPLGAPAWYVMADQEHTACTRHAPALGQPWGLEAALCPLVDTTGRAWRLQVAGDGSLEPVPQAMEDIPPLEPVLYARDCAEALRHIEAAGNLTTLWVG